MSARHPAFFSLSNLLYRPNTRRYWSSQVDDISLWPPGMELLRTPDRTLDISLCNHFSNNPSYASYKNQYANLIGWRQWGELSWPVAQWRSAWQTLVQGLRPKTELSNILYIQIQLKYHTEGLVTRCLEYTRIIWTLNRLVVSYASNSASSLNGEGICGAWRKPRGGYVVHRSEPVFVNLWKSP